MDKMKKTIKDFKTYSFEPIPIAIRAERKSGYIFVEGSQVLSEEITMIKGLDSDELKNYYLVQITLMFKKNIVNLMMLLIKKILIVRIIDGGEFIWKLIIW